MKFNSRLTMSRACQIHIPSVFDGPGLYRTRAGEIVRIEASPELTLYYSRPWACLTPVDPLGHGVVGFMPMSSLDRHLSVRVTH